MGKRLVSIELICTQLSFFFLHLLVWFVTQEIFPFFGGSNYPQHGIPSTHFCSWMKWRVMETRPFNQRNRGAIDSTMVVIYFLLVNLLFHRF